MLGSVSTESVEEGRDEQMQRLPAKLRDRITGGPNGCWSWNGQHRKRDGRPVLNRRYVYHLTYEHLRGQIPDGKILHHRVCNNKRCVNPFHVEAITQSEHMVEHGFGGDQRVGQALKTHCPAGHPYDGENTLLVTRRDRPGQTERHCKACTRERRRRQYYANIDSERAKARERARQRAATGVTE